MIEIRRWLPVKGYEGWYEVSSDGHIRRIIANHGKVVNRVLRPQGKPYHHVRLSMDGNKSKIKLVHRLVCEAFRGSPPPRRRIVNHRDGIKTNNHYTNLEWSTYRQNAKHALKVLGTIIPYGRNKSPMSMRGAKHPKSKNYIITKPDGVEITITGLSEFCRQHKLCTSCMSQLAVRQSKGQYKGWKCRYAD